MRFPVHSWFFKSVVNFSRHRAHLLAGAISYFALLSLLPFLYFSILILGYIIGSSEAATGVIVDYIHRLLPFPVVSIQKQVLALVSGGRLPSILAVISLFLGTGMAFTTIENAVAQIQGRPHATRRVHHRLAWSYLAVLALTTALVLTHFTSTAFSWAQKKGILLGNIDLGKTGAAFLIHLGAPLTVMVSFMLLLYMTPSRRPPVFWAFGVAVVLTVVWRVGGKVFRWYTSHIVPLNLIYGPVASIIAFLLFVYLSAILFLWGVEFLTVIEDESAGSGTRLP